MKKRTLLVSLLAVWCSAGFAVTTEYDPSLLSSNLFTDITRDSRGYLWVATEYGLNRFDGISFISYYGDYGREGDLFTSRVVQLYADSAHVDGVPPLWVMFYGAIQYYVPEKDAFYTVDASQISSPAFTTLTRVDDAILAYSKGTGWFRMERVENGWRAVPTDEKAQERTKRNVVSYTDRDGIIWEGTPRQTLRRISPEQSGATYIAADETWSNGRPFYTVLSDAAGHVYVAQEKNGLRQIERNGKQTGYTLLPGRTMSCNLTLRNSDVLIGTTSDGIYRLHSVRMGTANPKMTHIAVPHNRVKSLVEAPDGTVYVGIMQGGVMQLRPNEDTISTIDGYEPSNVYVNKLALDANGMLWVGHYSGIDCYDTHAHRMVQVMSTDDPSITQSLRSSTVYDILFKGNRILLASNKGLYVVTPQTDGNHHWRQYTMEDGLPSNVVCRILEDGKGRLWVSTFHGISSFELPATDTGTPPLFINYLRGNGLQAYSYLRSAGEKLPTGELVFPDDGGFTVLAPEHLSGRAFDRPVVLSSLVVSGKRIGPTGTSGNRPIMQGAVDEVEELSLSYTDNLITMHFSPLDMRDNANVCYEYRFANSDNNAWHSTMPGENSLTFNNLGYGRHVLFVRARDGVEYSDPRRWIINVRPPFYLSGWAYLCYLALLAWGIFYFVRTYNHRKEQKLLREELQFYINRSHELPMLLTVDLKGNDQQLMEKMMKVITDKLDDSELDVETLADAVGVSRAQLQRRVKDITGVGVGTFIRELRLKQAAQMLRKGDIDIAQVAYTVGFSAPNVFSTAFKKYFGVTPTEYTNAQQANNSDSHADTKN